MIYTDPCLFSQISHTDTPMYILGYIQRDSRIYLADKDLNVTSFALSVSLLEYETFVLRGDLDAAAELLVCISILAVNCIYEGFELIKNSPRLRKAS